MDGIREVTMTAFIDTDTIKEAVLGVTNLCLPYIYYLYNCIPVMNFWLASLLIWLVIDLYRYIRYIMVYRRLNGDQKHRDTNHENIKKLLQDLRNYPDIFEDLVRDFFFNRVRLEDMNFDDVCISLFEMTGEHEQYRDTIKKTVKRFQLYQRKKGRNVFTSDQHHARVRHYKHDLSAWFNILPMYIATRAVNMIVEVYMRILGYKYYRFKSGLKIWYSKYDSKRGTPLIFFHASVGGVSVQYSVLGHFHSNHNIIMPEIPGVSFLDTHDRPPPISEIIENVHEFLLNHYIEKKSEYFVDSSKLKVNLMGHSLGCSVCSAYINKYPKNIDSFFCVEGQIFFPRAIRLSEDFYAKLEEIPTEDLISVPLFHRDLYVQYFIIKRLTIDSTMLFDLSSEDKKHIKIHMYHVKDDRRILIRPQLEYATRKKINIVYHLFDGDYSHGSFVLNKKIRNYIIGNIQRVYDEHKYLQFDILTKKTDSVEVGTVNSINSVSTGVTVSTDAPVLNLDVVANTKGADILVGSEQKNSSEGSLSNIDKKETSTRQFVLSDSEKVVDVTDLDNDDDLNTSDRSNILSDVNGESVVHSRSKVSA
ncbi:hypothetical protein YASMINEVIRUS_236 [Yasminevirus sp. GU-2018]|uniref:Uncharacterized protein n=1 Tax=Yasminevirus sp. GU-2018 TaxID=2420051 RepID=A0A5K0U8U7_9VIRU|nr:hypothetical protein YASMINEVIRUS_236 [Yasminevirus sp. GU-2018]